MQTHLSLANMLALFGTMAVLAFVPSMSALMVATRSAASGLIHGIMTAIGIVLGDIIFILVAIYGLSLLADTLGDLFVWIKYLGGAYLIWLGISLVISKSRLSNNDENNDTAEFNKTSKLSSFMAGLLITLADQKAILFYLGFFPAFVNLETLTILDTSIILTITIISVGGAKLIYALMADQSKQFFTNSRALNNINRMVGIIIIAVGLFIVAT